MVVLLMSLGGYSLLPEDANARPEMVRRTLGVWAATEFSGGRATGRMRMCGR